MTTSVISLESIHQAIRNQYRQALETERHWHYVRVWPDGSITSGMEVSRCVPESEYFRRGTPHPVTVWSMKSNPHGMSAEEIDNELCEFDPSDLDQDITRTLTEAGYKIE